MRAYFTTLFTFAIIFELRYFVFRYKLNGNTTENWIRYNFMSCYIVFALKVCMNVGILTNLKKIGFCSDLELEISSKNLILSMFLGEQYSTKFCVMSTV